MPDKFLRGKQVAQLSGLSRTTIWRLERRGQFPARRQISPGAVGYLASEVQEWIDGRQPVSAQQAG